MAVVVARLQQQKKSFGGTRHDGPLEAEQALEFWAHRAEYYDRADDDERDHRGGRHDGEWYREIGVL